MELILALLNTGWENLFVLIVGLAFIIGLLYMSKRLLDEETYAIVRAKIMAFEVKAEQDITGEKCGVERMERVKELVSKNFSPRELKVVNKRGGVSKVAEKMLPIAKMILPLIFFRKR